MGTHPIFESDFDCLTEKNAFATPNQSNCHPGTIRKLDQLGIDA